MSNIFDPTPGMQPGPDGSATRAVVIVPKDGVDLPMMARRIYVGTGGDICLLTRDNTLNPAVGSTGIVANAVVTFHNVPGGKELEVWTRQVWATGTTATGLVALA